VSPQLAHRLPAKPRMFAKTLTQIEDSERCKLSIAHAATNLLGRNDTLRFHAHCSPKAIWFRCQIPGGPFAPWKYDPALVQGMHLSPVVPVVPRRFRSTNYFATIKRLRQHSKRPG